MSSPPGIGLPNPTGGSFSRFVAPPRSDSVRVFRVTEDNLDDFVNTPEFDQQCAEKARQLAFSSDKSYSYEESLRSGSDSVSSATAAESSPHEVPRVEARLYYAGIKPKGRGPKLVYRTSSDVFEEPSGPEAYARLMRVIAVPDDHEFGENGKWDTVRNKVVELLNQRNIKITSVDFVRFTWLDKKPDQEIEEEEEEDHDHDHDEGKEDDDYNEDDYNEDDYNEDDYDKLPTIKPVEYGNRHVTNPTIWVGVLPDTLTGAIAYESAKDIRAFLNELQVQDIDIAYRESTSKFLLGHGPALFPPVGEGDALERLIGNVSVPLGLPIAGLKTDMQGTLGPYFHVGDKLYAITVRHNLFPVGGDNDEYRYHRSGRKKEVVVMGTPAFANYLDSIQAHIDALNDSVDAFQGEINTYSGRVADGTNVAESQTKLEEHEGELAKVRIRIVAAKKFYVNMKKRWSSPNDRIIGFVAWAPSIGLDVPPHGYTRDLCVIELYKERFKHMIGNVLRLGPEYDRAKIKSLIYDRVDVPSEFKYSKSGLLHLRGMLTAEQVNNPNRLNLQGERIRRVLKRGFTTRVTVGTLTSFRSFMRQYSTAGNMESLELAILPHEKKTGPFSRGGDSGSLIVSALGEFVGLLTGGLNSGTDSADITYATPFEWVWELVCAEFPGADLYFDDLKAFFADVA